MSDFFVNITDFPIGAQFPLPEFLQLLQDRLEDLAVVLFQLVVEPQDPCWISCSGTWGTGQFSLARSCRWQTQ